MPTTWRLVAGVGLLLGVGEVIDSFFIGWGAIAALAFAALFFLGVWLTARGRVVGIVLIAVMCALEIAAFPTLKRTTTFDWVFQILFLALAATGIVAAVTALVQRHRASVSPG